MKLKHNIKAIYTIVTDKKLWLYFILCQITIAIIALAVMGIERWINKFHLEDREEAQKTIDHYWNEGMKILHKAKKQTGLR